MCFLLTFEDDREWTDDTLDVSDSSIGSSHETDSWLLPR
jgi:hypothetical protein